MHLSPHYQVKPSLLIFAVLLVDPEHSTCVSHFAIMSAYDTSSFPLTSDELPGVIALGTIATISTISVSLLLLHLLIIALTSRRGRNHDERIFLRTHLGALVVCLLLSDLIQGLCGMVQLVWASNGRVYTGFFCMAQAVMLHIGDVGTAFWNATIAIHTFWTVVLGKRMTTIGIASLIGSGWAFCFILTMIGPFAIQTKENGPFYAIAGAWCFITDNYQYPRIIMHYLPMLLSGVIITILYVHVALVLFGVLTVDGGTWRLKAPTRTSASTIRDFFGQFSWGRLYRRSGPAANQSIVIADHPDTGTTGVSDRSMDHGRNNKSTPLGNRFVNTPATQVEMSVFDNNHSSRRPLRLKMLGIKMLWYPSVYLVLILPIAISRIDPSVDINLDVMLVFTWLLLFMGTADTIIYLCTRRLGPAPWSRRNTSVSIPRSRSKPERGHAAATLSHGELSLQIQVEHYTMPAMDDQSIELACKKSTAASLTDISFMSSTTPVACGDHGADFTRSYGDKKSGFDFTTGKATCPVVHPSSPSDPNVVAGAYDSPISSLGHQEQLVPHTLSLPKPPVRQQEQLQEPTHREPHPYAPSWFPARQSAPSPMFTEV